MTLQLNPVLLELPVYLRLKTVLTHLQAAVMNLAGIAEADEKKALQREFMELIAKENANISRICFSYAGSVADFDDLRQDALINIWRGMKTFRGEASRRSWVYRVTINSCLSTIRKQNRHRHESLEQLYGLIETDNDNREAIEQMHRIISTLNREDKAIIMMWLDEMGYEEIAANMGLNRNTVATRIKRIKEKIANKYNRI